MTSDVFEWHHLSQHAAEDYLFENAPSLQAILAATSITHKDYIYNSAASMLLCNVTEPLSREEVMLYISATSSFAAWC